MLCRNANRRILWPCNQEIVGRSMPATASARSTNRSTNEKKREEEDKFKETTLERAVVTIEQSMFVTAEKGKEM